MTESHKSGGALRKLPPTGGCNIVSLPRCHTESCEGCEQWGLMHRVGERWRGGPCTVCECLHGAITHCSPYCPLGSCPQVRGLRLWRGGVGQPGLGKLSECPGMFSGLTSMSHRAGSWWREWENRVATVRCRVSGSEGRQRSLKERGIRADHDRER